MLGSWIFSKGYQSQIQEHSGPKTNLTICIPNQRKLLEGSLNRDHYFISSEHKRQMHDPAWVGWAKIGGGWLSNSCWVMWSSLSSNIIYETASFPIPSQTTLFSILEACMYPCNKDILLSLFFLGPQVGGLKDPCNNRFHPSEKK